MRVETAAEWLLFTTMRIVTPSTVGTGAIVEHSWGENLSGHFLITNKHVVENAKSGRLTFTAAILRGGRIRGPELGRQVSDNVAKDAWGWIGHPSDAVDVAALPLGGVLNHFQEKKEYPYYRAIPTSMFPGPDAFGHKDAIEDILFIGYPSGIYDQAKDTLNKSVGLCHSTMSPRRERMFGVNDAMDQPTFADLEYDGKKRKTRREIFLERMDSLIPWGQIEERIRPFYPKAGRGRRPYELSVMLRIHCVQLFYNLSDPGMEDMLYEVESVRRFVGLRLSGPLPDETTILNFRHLLEEHELGQSLFEEINRHLESQGLRLREGTIVDASIIEAPSSTKNRAGDRDPEMRQTKKGNGWHFGMKVHIGADAETGVVHSVATTPANMHDVTEAHRLLHGGEKRVWCDAGYQGVDKRAENRELGVEWQVAMRPGRRRQLEPGSGEALVEKRKASVRAKVEHPFLYVKRHFGYAKVRYRGLAKNTQRLMLLLGLTNLITAERYLVA